MCIFTTLCHDTSRASKAKILVPYKHVESAPNTPACPRMLRGTTSVQHWQSNKKLKQHEQRYYCVARQTQNTNSINDVSIALSDYHRTYTSCERMTGDWRAATLISHNLGFSLKFEKLLWKLHLPTQWSEVIFTEHPWFEASLRTCCASQAFAWNSQLGLWAEFDLCV